MNQNISQLHPDVLRWVWRQGWTALKPIQENAIMPVLSGDSDVLLSAATAGGKTEAAFLPIFSNLLKMPVEQGYAVLAISPLKSLINDQERRLTDMARDLPIDITAWHGDVANSSKEASRRKPQGVLLITPESLEAMLATKSSWARNAFSNLRYVVIDELHAFLGTERGKQLQSLLNRIEHLAGRKMPRIALSATISNPESVKAFLRPDSSLPMAIPDAGGEAHPVQLSIKEYVADEKHDPEPLIAKELFARLRGSNNLVFTNSRKEAEAYAVALNKMSQEAGVPNEFRIHHGSLSRLDRQSVEQDLQKGHVPVTAICTASMELGVDIGKVKSVAQIGTAGSAASLRQRLGRSGRRGEPSVIRIFSVDEARDDYKFHLRSNLVQNIAVTELLRAKRYDNPLSERAFLGVLVQQLVSLLSQAGSFYAEEAYKLLCSDGAFAFVPKDEFAALLQHLQEKKIVGKTSNGQIVIGLAGERMLKQRDFYSAFTTAADYTIIDTATHRTVGSVQYKPYYGEIFILAGQHWIVDAVEEKSSTVYVSATHSKGKMMFEGTGPDTSAEVTLKMKEIYENGAMYPYLDASTGTSAQLEAARAFYDKSRLADNPYLEFGDGIAAFTWSGMRVNRTISLMTNVLLDINPPYDHLALNKVGPDTMAHLSKYLQDVTDLEAFGAFLASHVPNVKKQRGKWDVYLPDEMLNEQYAALRLDVQGAKEAVKRLAI